MATYAADSARVAPASPPPTLDTRGLRLAAAVPFFTTPPAERVAAMIAAGPPPNLNAFLASARRYIDSPMALAEALAQYKPMSGFDPPQIEQMRLHVVLGNEASDMDSMVTSLVLAWYLQALYPPHSGNLFVPLMNLARSEIALRSDVLFAFARVGLDTSLLWCKDEVDWAALHRRAAVAAVLTDHNNLSAELEPPLAPFVVGVLDHHRDEGLYPLSHVASNRRIVFPTGSCSSLLGELMLRNAPWILSAAAFGPIDSSPHAVMPGPLAALTLLQSTLLMDTSNLSDKPGKKTAIDEAVSQLYARLLQDLTYQEMHRRRNDVSNLTTAQLLVKDTKYGESQKYPHFIASVPGSMAAWARRDPRILENIEAFARQRGVRFVVLLTAYVDTSHPADAAVHDPVTERARTLGQPSSVETITAAAKAAATPSPSAPDSASPSPSPDPMHGSSAGDASANHNRAVQTGVGAAAAHAASGTFKREITLLVLQHIPDGVVGSGGPHAPPGATPVTAPLAAQEGLAGGADSQPQSFVERSPNVHVVGRPLTPVQLQEALLRAFEQEGPERRLDAVRADGILPEEIMRAAPSHSLLVTTLNQRNTKGSRKQVAPLIDSLLSKL